MQKSDTQSHWTLDYRFGSNTGCQAVEDLRLPNSPPILSYSEPESFVQSIPPDGDCGVYCQLSALALIDSNLANSCPAASWPHTRSLTIQLSHGFNSSFPCFGGYIYLRPTHIYSYPDVRSRFVSNLLSRKWTAHRFLRLSPWLPSTQI